MQFPVKNHYPWGKSTSSGVDLHRVYVWIQLVSFGKSHTNLRIKVALFVGQFLRRFSWPKVVSVVETWGKRPGRPCPKGLIGLVPKVEYLSVLVLSVWPPVGLLPSLHSTSPCWGPFRAPVGGRECQHVVLASHWFVLKFLWSITYAFYFDDLWSLMF